MCASKDQARACWSFDGSDFAEFGSTKAGHRLGAMSTFRNGVTIAGGQADSNSLGREHETHEGMANSLQLR